MPGTGDDSLAGVAGELARLTAGACGGSPDGAAALTALAAVRRIAAELTALAAVRRIAAELDRSELALIEAARDGGATGWGAGTLLASINAKD
jgi:hypothetical protein